MVGLTPLVCSTQSSRNSYFSLAREIGALMPTPTTGQGDSLCEKYRAEELTNGNATDRSDGVSCATLREPLSSLPPGRRRPEALRGLPEYLPPTARGVVCGEAMAGRGSAKRMENGIGSRLANGTHDRGLPRRGTTTCSTTRTAFCMSMCSPNTSVVWIKKNSIILIIVLVIHLPSLCTIVV